MRQRSRRRRSHFRDLTLSPLSIEPLEERQLLTAMPVISEFMAANDGGLNDENGDPSDWIELTNIGTTAASLAGWHLTDNAGNLSKWTLPAVTLNPNSRMIIFASGKDRAVAGQILHTNFSLSSEGEYLALVQPDGTTIANDFGSAYPGQRSNTSYGLRGVAGVLQPNESRYFSPSSPGAINGEGFVGIAATPTFSLPHGFYDSVQNVSISTSTPGATLRYTLDGTAPTASSTVYTAPLAIGNMTVLRAASFLAGYLPSDTETASYLFINDVMTQTRPASYPTSWGTAPAFPELGLPSFNAPGDYDIDPEIVNDPAYTADFLAGLTAIPTVSVVMNANDLFGAAGIYSHPWERGDLWERATSIELINPDGTPGFQIDAGVRILGNASRQPMLSPKHSLRIEFRSQYGASELDYPLFGPDSPTTFDSIVLRAELSDSWVSPQGAAQVLSFVGTQGRPRAQYARDNFTRETQLAMGQLAPQSNYVHVYINGLYWGIHDLIERRDADFVASHEGGVPEDYDVLQDDVFGDSGLVVEGDTVAWDAMFALANSGLANNAQYQAIQQYLDIDAFIDYMNLHLYVGSQDWPNNNWTAMRKREPGATFRFFTWDAEYTLHDPTINRTGVNDPASPGQLFAALRNNAEFRLRFADRAHTLLFNGGLLTPGPAAERFLGLVSQLDDAIVAESARWGDYRRDVHTFIDPPFALSTRDDQWMTERTRLLGTYFPTRTGNVINQYIAANLYPGLAAPTFNQHGGEVTSGFQVTMSASAPIYYTLDGSDPRLPGGGIAPGALLYSAAETLIANTRVQARAKNGSLWSALNSADFTVEIPQLRITELMYHPPASPPGGPFDKEEFEFIEVQNIGATPLNLAGITVQTAVDFTFPNVVLQPGEFGVIVENQVAFESRYGAGINILGQYSGKLDNGGEQVALRGILNVPIQTFNYLDDDWYPTTDGAGRSLVIRDSAGDLSLWSQQIGWRPSTNSLGSPGAADPLVLNRRLFYNQSRYDDNTPGISASDDGAIASDKVALLPGQTATFANVSSYTRGLNGILFDVAASVGSLTAADFIFRVGNNNAPSTWSAGPAPLSISVRAGAGVSGSDRVELVWANGAISKTWLEVVVLANENTRLSQLEGYPAGYGDVFYFGSALGNSGLGDSATQATVNVSDELGARNNPAAVHQNIPLTNLFDYNRDGAVNTTDALAARNNATSAGTVLRFLSLGNPPAGPIAAPLVDDAANEAGIATALTLATIARHDTPGIAGSVRSARPSATTESGGAIAALNRLLESPMRGRRTLAAAHALLAVEASPLEEALADLLGELG